ncbi:MAG TPA: hypothetical protein VF538_04330 [Pyrinomonadaceae bacterium]|jgi:hypothetical protein
MNYIVRTEDNSHYGDESARRTVGEYEDAEVAVAAAKQIVDADLDSLYRGGMTPDELFSHYTAFGHDAYIISNDDGCQFSARNYAAERCREICSGHPEAGRHTS